MYNIFILGRQKCVGKCRTPNTHLENFNMESVCTCCIAFQLLSSLKLCDVYEMCTTMSNMDTEILCLSQCVPIPDYIK